MGSQEYRDIGLSNSTIRYLETTSIDYRKELGQYFTPKVIRDRIWDYLPGNYRTIWEPSAGTGEFLSDLIERHPESEITASEIDVALSAVLASRYKGTSKVRIIQEDTLRCEHSEVFDLVVGNPPYFELKGTRSLSRDDRKRFEEVISGRVNIFSLFIKIAIDSLKVGGRLAFVVPPSMNNGAYFENLRRYIVRHTRIVNITILRENEFQNAQQSVMVIILEKGGTSRDFIFERGDTMIFTEKWKELEEEFGRGKTLKQLGFKVITGPVVWNQNKNLLAKNATSKKKNVNLNTFLVWSHNIVGGKIVKGEKKQQYINLDSGRTDKTKPRNFRGPAIVVNRIVGSVGSGTIRAAVWDREESFTAENHVNVILPVGHSDLDLIRRVHQELQTDRVSNIVRMITGNVQISKKELEGMIPLSI